MDQGEDRRPQQMSNLLSYNPFGKFDQHDLFLSNTGGDVNGRVTLSHDTPGNVTFKARHFREHRIATISLHGSIERIVIEIPPAHQIGINLLDLFEQGMAEALVSQQR